MSAIYNGYTVLSMKFNENSTENFIFLKKHNVRDQSNDTPRDRTLFVQGLPPYCTKALLTPLFSKFGKVVQLYLHSKPTTKNIKQDDDGQKSKYFSAFNNSGFKVAYVIYQNESSINQILSLPSSRYLLLTSIKNKNDLNIGINQWKLEYTESIIDKNDLQKEIDEYMMKYDEQKTKEEEKNKEVIVDDDGWETVTRKGKNPVIARKESVNKHITRKERMKKTRKQLLNFYTFQIKESKMNHLESLRKKLEEDKQKIDLLKKSRRFKPF